jgi:phosphotransferase system  glucose/maltose/N-acetylglucosamine-specific IIC component
MDLMNAHAGVSFSGGVFDFVLFGILPEVTGNSTGI